MRTRRSERTRPKSGLPATFRESPRVASHVTGDADPDAMGVFAAILCVDFDALVP
jgi:hypothetical protein